MLRRSRQKSIYPFSRTGFSALTAVTPSLNATTVRVPTGRDFVPALATTSFPSDQYPLDTQRVVATIPLGLLARLSGGGLASLEPGEMVVGDGLLAGHQRVDGCQQLPVAHVVGVHIVRIAFEYARADRSKMLVQQFDFFVQPPGAGGSRFGQRVGQPRQPVAPLGRLAELPTEFVDVGHAPRPRRGGARLTHPGRGG